MKTENKFAKVITLKDYQVVAMKDFDNEEDSEILWLITTIDGVLFQTRAEFKDIKIRDKAFDEYGKENAQRFLNEALFMLS